MPQPDDCCVYSSVCPTPNRILWGILPGLQAVSTIQVMCGLPVIEHFIAVLYRREQCSEDIGSEEYIERNDRLELRRLWLLSNRLPADR